MKYRIVMSNYTVSVSAAVLETLKTVISQPEKQWMPMEIDPGKWIVPAHVIAIEEVTVIDAPPEVLTFPADA